MIDTEKLILACKSDDRNAQKMIYSHFYGLVMSVAKRYSGSTAEAEELCNDIFYKVFTKISQYQSNTNFRSWLLKVAHRTSIDAYRKVMNNPEVLGDDHIPDLGERCDLDLLNKIEVAEKIILIQKLSPAYRLVFNLYVIEGYTHEEIAQETGLSVGTSKSNLFKARNQLKMLIQKYQLT